MAERVTTPPPAGWLATIGYVLSASVGAAAVGVAYCVVRALQGDPAYLLAIPPLAVAGWAFAYANRHAVAWWVRRQEPDPLR